MKERTRRVVVLLGAVAVIAGCATSGDRGERASERTVHDGSATNAQLAAGYLEQGRHELALQKIKRALEMDPTNPQAHTVAGVIYDTIGDREAAGQHYARAVRLDGRSGHLLNNYGQYLCKSGRADEGVVHLNKAVQDPFYRTPWVALTNAGDCEERRNDAAAAERYYRAALEARERYPDALYRMARLKLSSGEAFKARAFLQRYEETAMPSAEALRLGMQIEKALGNEEGVRGYEQELRRLFPDEARAS